MQHVAVDIGEAEIPALIAGGEPAVVDAGQVEDSGLHVVDMHGAGGPFIFDRLRPQGSAVRVRDVVAEVVGLPVGDARLHAAAGLTGTAAAPLGDASGTGVPNLIKFALNLDPLRPNNFSSVTPASNSDLPAFTALTTMFPVEFVRRRNSGLIYTPMRCTSFTNCIPMTGTPVVTIIDANWERVVVEEPPGNALSGFSRVSVTIP